MQLSKQQEKEVLQVYKTWLHSYLNGDVETYNFYLDEDYHFIGSTGNEEFLNRTDTTNFFRATADQLSGKTEIRNDTKTIEQFGDIVFITHLLDAWFFDGKEWVFYNRFRFTNALKKKTEGWRFIYQHYSIPDAKANEGETIGYDLVSIENQQLREAVKRRTIELEQKNRELEVETALQRIRARVSGMEKSEDLLDIVVEMRKEFVQLGHEAHYFWHMRWHPEKYEKAMTSGDGKRIGMVMELPRKIHGEIEELATWESSEEPTIIFTMDVDAALDYVHKMTEWGDFKRVDPNMPSEDDLKHIGGLTYVMARTSLGEIGYSLPGVVKHVPQSNLDILVRFARTFDLAHKRFEDLKNRERQIRETQFELALEKVRSRTMAMQSSDELREAANLLFLEIQALGIPTWSAGYNILTEDKRSAECWMSSEGKIQDSFMLYFKEEKSFIEQYEFFLSDDVFFVQELSGEELVSHYNYMRTIPKINELINALEEAGIALPTHQINHLCKFKQGYLLFITYEPVPEAHEIFTRFTKVFEQTYTRFLDLKKAEAQTRESKIEAALEKVRSRSLAVKKADEFNEVVKEVFIKLSEFHIPISSLTLITFPKNSEDWVTYGCAEGESGIMTISFHVPYFKTPFMDNIIAERAKNPSGYHNRVYTEAEKNHYYEYVFEHTELKNLPEDLKKKVWQSKCYGLSAAFTPNSMIVVNDFEGNLINKDQASILKRFSKVFEQAYIRFLDLQRAEAQAREAQIEAALERVRSRTMSMRHSDELREASHILDQEVRRLGVRTWGCAFNIYRENDSIEWFGNEKGILPQYIIPREGIFKKYYDMGKEGREVFVQEFAGQDCVAHYENMSALPIIGDVLKELKKTNGSYPTYQIDHVIYFKYGYLLFITTEFVPVETHNIFKRFAKVFEQAYIRFLDLQKAENQAQKIKEERDILEKTLQNLRTTQAQLIQSEKMASLGELTAGIAHEIQNPLNFVNNFSEVSSEMIDELAEGLENEDYEEVKSIFNDLRENLEKIQHHGKRADSIVKGMLMHSRSGKGEKLPTDINALCDEFLRLSYHGLRAKDRSFNADFEMDFDESLPNIDVVPQDIGRVLLNLINNAFQACNERSEDTSADPRVGATNDNREPRVENRDSSDGQISDEQTSDFHSAKNGKWTSSFAEASADKEESGKRNTENPKVIVRTKRLVTPLGGGDSREAIQISVSDNGPGIPDNIKDKIFQPFFTTKPTGEGTGLGLSLAYDIVKAHGGEIRVESEEGEGTEFIIQLPVV